MSKYIPRCCSGTQWTTGVDLKNLVFYYHTDTDRQLRKLDLKRIDFGAIGTDPVHQPLRGEETNIIKDIAPLRWFTCLRRLEITDELPTIKRYRT